MDIKRKFQELFDCKRPTDQQIKDWAKDAEERIKKGEDVETSGRAAAQKHFESAPAKTLEQLVETFEGGAAQQRLKKSFQASQADDILTLLKLAQGK